MLKPHTIITHHSLARPFSPLFRSHATQSAKRAQGNTPFLSLQIQRAFPLVAFALCLVLLLVSNQQPPVPCAKKQYYHPPTIITNRCNHRRNTVRCHAPNQVTLCAHHHFSPMHLARLDRISLAHSLLINCFGLSPLLFIIRVHFYSIVPANLPTYYLLP